MDKSSNHEFYGKKADLSYGTLYNLYDKSGKDGSNGTVLNLTVSDWLLLGVPENAKKVTAIDGNTSAPNTNTSANTQNSAAQNVSDWDFDDDGFFTDMEVDPDTLPF